MKTDFDQGDPEEPEFNHPLGGYDLNFMADLLAETAARVAALQGEVDRLKYQFSEMVVIPPSSNFLNDPFWNRER